MRIAPIALSLLLFPLVPAYAQTSVGISTGGVRIGIRVSAYPELVQVPGYPVYYAPQLKSNYFFYEGLYWVYEGDNWYSSSWYNGPWSRIGRTAVPSYLLRVPVRYYRSPPTFFRGWGAESAPRWGERWGPTWDQQRRGWNDQERRSNDAPAPLPTYQRQFSGRQYPRTERQQDLHGRNYSYQPRDEEVRPHYPAPQRPEVRESRPASYEPAQQPAQGGGGVAPRQDPPNDANKGGGREREEQRGR